MYNLPPGEAPMLDRPHLALAGRSNAGKSSLANKLAGAVIARTSKTPGRTQFIGIYNGDCGESSPWPVAVADLPGFGYAKVRNATRNSWEDEMPRYFESKAHILTLLCVDPRLPPQESDLAMLDWLAEFERPALVVATKWDRCNQKARGQARRFSLTYHQHPVVKGWFPVSNLNGEGLPELKNAIRTYFAYAD